jgi:hypothetical protein
MGAKTVKNRGAFYVNGDYIIVPVRDVSAGYFRALAAKAGWVSGDKEFIGWSHYSVTSFI